MNYTAKVIETKECGLKVARLLVWKDGQLILCRTHMSTEGAWTQWLTLKAQYAIAGA